VVVVSAAVDSLPLVAFAPLQPPDAAHEAASVELQVSVASAPDITLVGATDSVTVGVGGGVTVTVAEATPTPPVPVQVKV
jgi:hypothetical protein